MKCYADETEFESERRENAGLSCNNSLGLLIDGYCSGYWDSLVCWNHTAPGTYAEQPCPNEIGGSQSPAGFNATKFCTENGTWFKNMYGVKWADYTHCIQENDFLSFQLLVRQMFVSGYSISFLFLSVAFCLFTFMKALRSTKTMIHQHLILSFLLTCGTQITWNSISPITLHENPVWCRFVQVLMTYSLVTNYMWMFSEGLFLHCILVCTYVSEKKIYYWISGIGWVLPALPVGIYVVMRQYCLINRDQRNHCWISVISEYWWIYASFSMFLLFSNFLFLCNIVRIVFSKSKEQLPSHHSHRLNQLWKTGKALLILFPLLGLQYVLSSTYRPPDSNSIGEATYQIINTFVTSLQGFFVALVVCFFNGEVQNLLKRRWHQWKTRMGTSQSQGRRSRASAGTLDIGLSSIPTNAKPPTYNNLINQEPPQLTREVEAEENTTFFHEDQDNRTSSASSESKRFQ